MLGLGRSREQIKLLHLVPRFHSNLSGHTKKNNDASLRGNLGKEFQVRALYGPSPSAPPDMSQWQQEEALSNAEENCMRKATFEYNI
jgi:hypothetical protein